ncbi:MAG: adenosylcobinamide-phosphate synthase CbiB [Eubacteriales bacterium]|nr:adenosylcobinamide-phosphate synthase CbiB [Eubacteriales bacterium]
MKLSLLALAVGFIADLLFGDPRWIYHPVRMIGSLIAALEKILRNLFHISIQEPEKPSSKEKSTAREGVDSFRRREFLAGTLLAVIVIFVSSGIPLLILLGAQRIHPYLRLTVESIFCWQLLAMKSLKDESMKVYDRLKEHDLEGARRAVSMIVGRDTQRLDEAGTARAAIETVAENASDGVIAPLLYMAVGGAPLGFFYKAINTMDSMVGYKNERYLYFGRFAAKLDDVANFIPARLSALFMIAASGFCGMDMKHAWRIFKRDRMRHASPNSAQTEAVMAGALKVQLAGDAWYFGELYKKETIGDDIRPVEPKDIVRANRLMYAASVLALLALEAIMFFVNGRIYL